MSVSANVFEIKRFAVHDGPGVRTTLFLKGCSLRCRWCHNPESVSSEPQLAYFAHKCLNCGECLDACPGKAHALTDGRHHFDRSKCAACGACGKVCLGGALRLFGRTLTVEEAVELTLEDRAFYETGGGVTLSGGEPLRQAEFCHELLSALKREHVHTAVDTCGFVNWGAFEKVLPVTDMFLFDIKHGDSAEHQKLTGQGNEVVLENLKRLSECGARIEARMPLVPGCNDFDENIHGTGALLGKLNVEKVKVLPYHSMARGKYAALGMEDTMPRVDPPTDEALRHVVEILRGHGVNAVSGHE